MVESPPESFFQVRGPVFCHSAPYGVKERKMTHNTSLTNALHIAAAAGLALFCQAGLTAQTMIGYLQQSPGHKLPVYPLVLPPQNCPAITFNPFTSVSLCVFGPFSLPGYAGTVYVGFSTTSGAVP